MFLLFFQTHICRFGALSSMVSGNYPLPCRIFHLWHFMRMTSRLTALFRLGVKTRIFHLGDYRRATIPVGQDIPDDYFFVNGTQTIPFAHRGMTCLSSCFSLVSHRGANLIHAASASSVLLRQKIVKKCREDIYHFLNHENGQIAIYDAVNPLASGRKSLANEFAKHDIEVGPSFVFEDQQD